ncbi:MAG: outer membrane protein transport protein [Candidatus Binatus sp.]
MTSRVRDNGERLEVIVGTVSRKVHKAISLATVILLAFVTSAFGAVLELYPTDLGTAHAGQAALAENASTAASNPAGMTLLDRSQLMTAPGALLPSTNFDVAPETTTKGGGGGNAGVFFPYGGFFYVRKLSERLRFGVAVYSDYGLGGDYGKTWVGRYYATSEQLVTGKINPSLAYEVNDWFSVGAGFSFGVGRFTFQSKVNQTRANPILPPVPDGGLAMESWDAAFGAKVGILLRPISKLRIGLTYQSPEDYKFGFRPHVTGLRPVLNLLRRRIGGVKVNVPLTEPQQVMLSGVYEVLPKWSLLADVGWQNWSAFAEFPVGISSPKQTTVVDTNLHFSDTCHTAIGQQLQIGEKWTWSAGFAYDSSPVSRANRVAVLPADRQLRYGTGLQYEVNNDIAAGFAWTAMDAGPGPFSNNRGPLAGVLQGHFSTNWLNFVALNIIWKF